MLGVVLTGVLELALDLGMKYQHWHLADQREKGFGDREEKIHVLNEAETRDCAKARLTSGKEKLLAKKVIITICIAQAHLRVNTSTPMTIARMIINMTMIIIFSYRWSRHAFHGGGVNCVMHLYKQS